MLFKTFRTIPERRGLPLLLPISTLRKTKDLSFPRAEHSFILLLPLCRKHAHVVSKQTNEKRAVGSSHPQANMAETSVARQTRMNDGAFVSAGEMGVVTGTSAQLPMVANAFTPLPSVVIVTSPDDSEVITMTSSSTVIVTPVIAEFKSAAQFVALSQFPSRLTVCGVPPSTVTTRVSAVASVPETTATVPKSASASAPLPAASIETELEAPVVADVMTRTPAVFAVTVAPVTRGLRTVAQLAAESQSDTTDMVCSWPPSTVTLRFSAFGSVPVVSTFEPKRACAFVPLPAGVIATVLPEPTEFDVSMILPPC